MLWNSNVVTLVCYALYSIMCILDTLFYFTRQILKKIRCFQTKQGYERYPLKPLGGHLLVRRAELRNLRCNASAHSLRATGANALFPVLHNTGLHQLQLGIDFYGVPYLLLLRANWTPIMIDCIVLVDTRLNSEFTFSVFSIRKMVTVYLF